MAGFNYQFFMAGVEFADTTFDELCEMLIVKQNSCIGNCVITLAWCKYRKTILVYNMTKLYA